MDVRAGPQGKLSAEELTLSNHGVGEDSSLDWEEIKPVNPKGSQSILKEISPEYSLEGLILKLKVQYFSHLMWIAESLKKTLMLGKI